MLHLISSGNPPAFFKKTAPEYFFAKMKISESFPELKKRERQKMQKREAIMKKRDKSASGSDSEFKKLPKRLQKLILRIYDEQETYEYDNLPGDNHYGYSFDSY